MAVVDQSLIQDVAQAAVPVLPNNGNPGGAYNMRANIGRGTLPERLRAKAANPMAVMPARATSTAATRPPVLPTRTV